MSDEIKIAVISVIVSAILTLPQTIQAVIQLKDRRNDKTQSAEINPPIKEKSNRQFSKKQYWISGISFLFNFVGTNLVINEVWYNTEPVSRMAIFWVGLGFTIFVIAFLLPIILRIYDFLDLDN